MTDVMAVGTYPDDPLPGPREGAGHCGRGRLMNVTDELRQHRLLLEDIFMAVARLNTWMGEEHRGESQRQWQSLVDVTDCLERAAARLNGMRDENGEL